jgi:hypothetical protein
MSADSIATTTMTQTQRSLPMSSQSSRCKAYVLMNGFLVMVLLMTSAVNYLWTADILYRYELTNSSAKTQTDAGPIVSKLLRHNAKAGPSKATNGERVEPTHIQQDAPLEEYDEKEFILSGVADSSDASELERQREDKQDMPMSVQHENANDLETAGLEGSPVRQEGDKSLEMASETPPDKISALKNVYADKMKEKNLMLSLKHQEKFVMNKASLSNGVPKSKRKRVNTGEHATIKLNDEYAYV